MRDIIFFSLGVADFCRRKEQLFPLFIAMRFLRFNFNHPIKGKACLMQLLTVNPVIKNIVVDSKLSNLVEIPIHDCRCGKWRIILDWDHDGRIFTHQEDFEVLKKKRVLL